MGDTDLAVIHESKKNSNEDTSRIRSVFEDKWSGTTSDVITFLCGYNLSQYAKLFSEQGIDLELFLTLTEDDLCEIGMSNTDDRKTLLNILAKLNKNREDKNLFTLDLSADEVRKMLSNTLSHLFMMHASLVHTRYQIRHPNVHNTSLNLHMSSAHLLDLLSSEALVQAKFLNNQLAALLNKTPGAAEKQRQQARKSRTLRFVTVLMTVTLFAYCVYKRLK